MTKLPLKPFITPGGSRWPLPVSKFILDRLARVGQDYISNMHRLYKEALRNIAEENNRKRPYCRTRYHSFEMAVQKLARAGLIEFSGQVEPSDAPQFESWDDPPERRYYQLAKGIKTPDKGEEEEIPGIDEESRYTLEAILEEEDKIDTLNWIMDPHYKVYSIARLYNLLGRMDSEMVSGLENVESALDTYQNIDYADEQEKSQAFDDIVQLIQKVSLNNKTRENKKAILSQLPGGKLPKVGEREVEYSLEDIIEQEERILALPGVMDSEKRPASMKKLRNLLDRMDSNMIDGLEDVENAIEEYEGVSREGQTAEEYGEEKLEAFEAIILEFEKVSLKEEVEKDKKTLERRTKKK